MVPTVSYIPVFFSPNVANLAQFMDGSCQLRKALAESILSPYTVLSVLPSLSYSWRSPLLCQLEASQLLLYFREHEVDCRCQIQ